MKISLKDKTALITGANGAIGRMVCHYLGGAGCKLLACHAGFHRDVAKQLVAEEKSEGCQIELLEFDVSNYEEAKDAIADGESKLGPVDIVVNVAGITRDKPLKKMTPADWQAVIDINLTGIYNVTQCVIEGMSSRGWGRVVNISSINGQKGQFGQANYSAAKAGVHGFTMAVAQEVAKKGVTVNTVSPGYIDSPMIRAVPEEIREQIRAGIPTGRFGMPEDVAAMVTFLASEQASWVTGADFSVNGGHFIH
ncbi:MAG: beta-ketoacyl-ACP reductase [Salinisphaeraceae bacterium]|nr:beta-ketoacyl-ACP reductase [Salinisphaeraceae bacterium]